MKKLILLSFIGATCFFSGFAYDVVKLQGRVLLDGKPVVNVPVTDGDQIVLSDSKGRYSMNSAPDVKFVYVTLPDG
ncbi:MAG: serine/threonine protein phosphatase, partial [Muribaculaceae bacterium]|nr:serine/threonine protein phosphatase [Muribaculaceae bacterium]